MNRNKALVFQAGIEAGIVDREEIIAWADGVLNSDEPYIDCIADLATCKEREYSVIFSLLGKIPGPTPESNGFWKEFKEFLKSKMKDRRIEPRNAVSMLYWHYGDGMLPSEVEDRIIQFKMDYDCVAEGYGDQSEIDQEVAEFFTSKAEQVAGGDATR